MATVKYTAQLQLTETLFDRRAKPGFPKYEPSVIPSNPFWIKIFLGEFSGQIRPERDLADQTIPVDNFVLSFSSLVHHTHRKVVF